MHYTVNTMHCTLYIVYNVHCGAVQCTLHCIVLSCPGGSCSTERRGRGGCHQIRFHLITHTMHCTALHCTALQCTELHCTELHCTATCTALHCTALHCTALFTMLCTFACNIMCTIFHRKYYCVTYVNLCCRVNRAVNTI